MDLKKNLLYSKLPYMDVFIDFGAPFTNMLHVL